MAGLASLLRDGDGLGDAEPRAQVLPNRPSILDLQRTRREGVFLVRLSLDTATLIEARTPANDQSIALAGAPALTGWTDVICLGASPVSDEAALCHPGGVVEFVAPMDSWYETGGRRVLRTELPWPLSCAFSPDGSRFVVTCRSGRVLVVDVDTLETLFRYEPTELAAPDECVVAAAAFNATGEDLYFAEGELLRHAVLATGAQRTLGPCHATTESLDRSPDGTALAVVSRQDVVVWDLDRESVRWSSHPGEPCRVSWSPEGDRIALCHRSHNRLVVHEAARGRAQRVRAFDRMVLDVCFAADGRHILCGFRDGVVRSWDPRTDEVRDLCQAPDLLVE